MYLGSCGCPFYAALVPFRPNPTDAPVRKEKKGPSSSHPLLLLLHPRAPIPFLLALVATACDLCPSKSLAPRGFFFLFFLPFFLVLCLRVASSRTIDIYPSPWPNSCRTFLSQPWTVLSASTYGLSLIRPMRWLWDTPPASSNSLRVSLLSPPLRRPPLSWSPTMWSFSVAVRS